MAKDGKNTKTNRAQNYTISKWYKGDDQKLHFRRTRATTQPTTTLRKRIQPGQILILLGGRFKGKRVVFLKQLKSGLLLVTGPHKINGVPLRRINQAYAIPTSTRVNLTGVNIDHINDEYFAKTHTKKQTKSEEGFFAVQQNEKSEEEKKRLNEKKTIQHAIDKTLIENIKKIENLKQYLSARFTLFKNTRPHELVF